MVLGPKSQILSASFWRVLHFSSGQGPNTHIVLLASSADCRPAESWPALAPSQSQRWYRGFEPAWGGRKKQSSGAGSIPKKGRGLPEKQSSAAAGAPKKRSRPPRKAKKQSQLREKQTRPPHFSLAGLRPADTHTDPDPCEEAFILLDHRG